MTKYDIPVRELTSKAAIFGIAAELIQTDMEHEKCADYRIGCCAAFNKIIYAAQDYIVGHVKRGEAVGLVCAAKSDFITLYRANGSRRTKDSVYWMGTRSDFGQKRRMNALLMAAKAL